MVVVVVVMVWWLWWWWWWLVVVVVCVCVDGPLSSSLSRFGFPCKLLFGLTSNLIDVLISVVWLAFMICDLIVRSENWRHLQTVYWRGPFLSNAKFYRFLKSEKINGGSCTFVKLQNNNKRQQMKFISVWNNIYLRPLAHHRPIYFEAWWIILRQWKGTPLVQVMVCGLLGVKPLPDSMLTLCQLEYQKHSLLNSTWKYKHFPWRKWTAKCHL